MKRPTDQHDAGHSKRRRCEELCACISQLEALPIDLRDVVGELRDILRGLERYR